MAWIFEVDHDHAELTDGPGGIHIQLDEIEALRLRNFVRDAAGEMAILWVEDEED